MNNKNHITVFEHETIRFDKGEKRITEDQFNALRLYYGEKGVPYYNICYNGIVFKEFVGVIQVGSTLIEVLPKADKIPASEKEEKKWRDILIDMMRAVGSLDIRSTSSSHLKIKPNTILDLYIGIFIKEVEYLLHNGLIKKYRKKEGNVTALKGSLKFKEHIHLNLTHQERFYVCHNAYDVEHLLHFIIYKTIRLLKLINTNTALHSRIGALMLYFPEMPDIKVSESTFNKLVFKRKTESYKKAIEISRLILLQYHPDLSKGRNHVLALMFDMNKLWEQFIFATLRKNKDAGTKLTAQTSKLFWKPERGDSSRIRPDIIVSREKDDYCAVLDTKWKNLSESNPSPEDLRQMYVYHDYYKAQRVALVFPGTESLISKGTYLDSEKGDMTEKVCSVISLSVESEIRAWQLEISKVIGNLMKCS